MLIYVEGCHWRLSLVMIISISLPCMQKPVDCRVYMVLDIWNSVMHIL